MIQLLSKHISEVARAIRQHRFETDAAGGRILVPKMGVFLGGAMKVIDYQDGTDQLCGIDGNTLLAEGLKHALNNILVPTGGYPQVTQWYIAPYSGDYTPTGAETAATWRAAATEFTSYTAGTRLALPIAAAATTPSNGNSGAPVQMIFNASGGPFNVYGAFLVSNSAKGNDTGKGLAGIRMDNPRTGMANSDKLGFEYVLTLADAG